MTITSAQLGYLLEGIDWRMPQHTWRPQAAGRSPDLNRSHDQRFGQRPRLVILCSAVGADDSLPNDVTTLQAMLRAERAARLAAEAEAQAGTLLIEKLKLTIKKLRHEQFGQSSERGALLDQLELQLANLEENAAQADTAAQMAAETIAVPSFERRKLARRPLPEHLPRERLVYPMPATCPCCGDSRLRKIGEDVTWSSFRASGR
ncbi:hypothetical protein [Bradyrhizobium sp. F1.4.3]|uniref:IS66 family transposase n=1 Tax=Bradyrhizobium sp. F1.4.3 TaxID=3156356 RepID=UPI00339821AF